MPNYNLTHFLSAPTILLLVFSLFWGDAFAEQKTSSSLPGFKEGVVAAAHPLASKVGIEILQRGGNAVDAAVATAFALGVVEPNASGIGGGGFMLIYMAKSKEKVTIDYRAKAPGKAKANMFLDRGGEAAVDQMKIGYRSVAVPGTVAGLALALQKYGTMDLKEVMEPAIQLAEQGFPVSKLLNSMMATNAGKLSQFPAAARVFLKHGRPYRVGERLFQKDLAGTYRLIVENGPDVFYKGAIAQAIVDAMKQGGGLITLEDLADYRPVLRPPVQGNYRGYEILSMGPPSSGGTQVIELLNILEGYDMARLGLNSPQSIAIMAEALKKVFADRAKYMGDPDFVKIPLAELLSKERAEKLRNGIKVETSRFPSPAVAAGFPLQESMQTTHLSIADRAGNLVALTQSLDQFFGSGVVVPGTGILLNDEMGDFSPEPGEPNSIAPGKRPLSSMAPTLVLKEGKPYLSIGMPGATRIISVLPQILMNLIDHGLPIQEAVNAPRIHCVTGELYLESRIPKQVRDALARKGYQFTLKKPFDLYFGGAQGVLVDEKTGLLYGDADPRREGFVLGY
jgi:gamma-glutamyltranspeptidase/glutathione hydrolase